MADLFQPDTGPDGAATDDPDRPLADRLRPKSLDEVIGQQHLVGPNGVLRRMIGSGRLGSLIFWGPPGTGKTTVARLLAENTRYRFEQISAVFSGVADLKKLFDRARFEHRAGHPTLLFVDEIHRFNRAQQDSFLPVMEDGTLVLIGATTENPSFELNSALLSRSQVLKFEPFGPDDLEALLQRAERETGMSLPLDAEARTLLLSLPDGDGRAILGLAEEILTSATPGVTLDSAGLLALVQRRAPIYDKAQDGHYNLISALHKTVRGSDPDAALYYLARMLVAGENPLFIARRLIRMASEDIGLADPQALPLAIAARDAYEMLGTPEGELALAEATVYLAAAPKSNAVYNAFSAAMSLARQSGSPTPPMAILNAPTRLMGAMGYGEGYIYDHDTPEGFSGQAYFPEKLGRHDFYKPVERGYEREIRKRLDYFARLRDKKSENDAE